MNPLEIIKRQAAYASGYKNIPAGVIAAGVPCKVIRTISEKDKIAPENILF